jgi:hypothetical protein
MPAESPTVAPCGVCQDLIEVGGWSFFDTDLEQFVCPDCGKRLRKAHAWLKHAGMKHCTTEPGTQEAA